MFCLHAAKLEAVSVGLVMRSQVVVVEHPNAEHRRIDAGAQEEDGDEARHLVGRSNSKKNWLNKEGIIIGIQRAVITK